MLSYSDGTYGWRKPPYGHSAHRSFLYRMKYNLIALCAGVPFEAA